MNHKNILQKATKEIESLKGQTLDVLDIKKPYSVAYAQHLAKVVSKISPLLGNMIEFSIVEKLNQADWKGLGKWIRQDPLTSETGHRHPLWIRSYNTCCSASILSIV